MKAICAVKIGDMRDPDPEKRGQVATLDIPLPEMGDEDVKIKVAYCAVCGSDPHLVRGAFGWAPPFGLGHEVSGIIVDLGKKAAGMGFKVGDRVAGNFLHFCGSCYYCNNGQQQFCQHVGEASTGMAEYVIWHMSQVFVIPDDISLRKGCMLEPVSVAVRIADKVRLKVGQRVAINGGGPIGLLALQVMRQYGATKLTLIEPLESRRDLALKYGAEFVVDPLAENLKERALSITDNFGYDVVIDCSGSPNAVYGLPPIVAKGGYLLYGSMYPVEFEMPLNLFNYMYANELTISGFFVSPYAFPRALQMLPKMDLDEFVVKSYPIDESVEAFEDHLSGKYLKILIECNADLADK